MVKGKKEMKKIFQMKNGTLQKQEMKRENIMKLLITKVVNI